MTDFSKLPAGTRVYSVLNGWGELCTTLPSNSSDYPIAAKFNHATMPYTLDGKAYSNNINPELYLTKPFEDKQEWEERMMEVSDDGDFWFMELVIAKTGRGYISYTPSNLSIYKHAREIPQLIEMTHTEAAEIIAQSKQCHPSQIKLVS